MTVFVLGGGPAGLAVAHGLSEGGAARFVLIERGRRLGGLAQTLEWEGIGHHDLGPHKIFTLDQTLMSKVEGLLDPGDWFTRQKLSSIYMGGHFLSYPPSPVSLIKVFGATRFASMSFDYGLSRIRSLLRKPIEPGTFEEDLRQRVGQGLYENLFRPIALKLWGDPATLDVKLSKGRVQTPSIKEVTARLLKLQKSSEFEALTFRYPRGGLQKLWDAICAGGQAGGEFLLERTVTGIRVEQQRVAEVSCSRSNGSTDRLEIGQDDFVVSTLPLGQLCRLMGAALPTGSAERVSKALPLNDLLLVFLHLEQASLFPESWIFVPDPAVAFHRVSEQESFDPGMTPHGSIVCCEIMSSPTRPMATRDDHELAELAIAGLQRMGFLAFRVMNTRVVRLPQSYPVYRVGYQAELNGALTALDRIENFRSIGRQGSFNYIGTLDAMDIGYGFVRWYCAKGGDWVEERLRTSHYPVLD